MSALARSLAAERCKAQILFHDNDERAPAGFSANGDVGVSLHSIRSARPDIGTDRKFEQQP
ncbi:hypothetical protein C4901_11600 [Acidiferrobacter sp. SPIII_3]|jgi:hypothetical protein|nr:hypothetical protein C4901_11600 [Acidiferrobacter sp. SPIII_3]